MPHNHPSETSDKDGLTATRRVDSQRGWFLDHQTYGRRCWISWDVPQFQRVHPWRSLYLYLLLMMMKVIVIIITVVVVVVNIDVIIIIIITIIIIIIIIIICPNHPSIYTSTHPSTHQSIHPQALPWGSTWPPIMTIRNFPFLDPDWRMPTVERTRISPLSPSWTRVVENKLLLLLLLLLLLI